MALYVKHLQKLLLMYTVCALTDQVVNVVIYI